MATTQQGRQDGLYSYESFSGNARKNDDPAQVRRSHFLWWCAGAYQDILKDCPSEQTKYAGLGGVLLATFVLASLSAGYAIYSVFNSPLWALAFAIIWGLVIFNFDRFLVSTMRKYGVSLRRQLWMAAPRIALALLIGFTIARPLELKIFEKEIDVRIVQNRHQKIQRNDSLLAMEDKAALTAAQTEKARLLARKAAVEDTLFQLQQAYIREADGTGGSMKRGIDKLTRLKQLAYEASAKQYAPEQQQLETQLHAADSNIGAINAAREVRRHQYEGQVTEDVGFLERNKALSDLAGEESSVWWANFLISLLIILIETGPILSKLIMSTGPYDLALARYELLQMAASEDEIRRDKALVIDKKEQVYQQKKQVSAELIEKLTGLQKKHMNDELDKWDRGERPSPDKPPLDELTKKIKDRYGYKEEDLL